MCVVRGILLIAGFVTHAVIHASILDAFAAGEGAEKHVFPLVLILVYVGSIGAGHGRLRVE